MSITLIKYGITKNLGNYESERIDAEYQVGEGQCAMEAMIELKAFVNSGVVPSPKKEEPKKEEEVKEEPKKEEEVKEEPKKEEPKKTTKKKVEPKKEEVKEEPKKTTKKPKEIPYSRKEKTHKAILATVLGDKFPTWKQDAELKARALETSQALEGVPVMDNKGTMLPSFLDKVVELMSDEDL